MFSGSIVALITPFDNNNKIDEKKLKELVEFHIKNGTKGICPCGTTGEASTLNDSEKERIVEIVVQTTKKRVPVIAGAGSNDTEHAIQLAQTAQKKGADALLIVTPYYNRPTQEGMFRHYKAIDKSVNIPIILYNVPSRTGSNLLPQTVIRLHSECKNIIGVKEASGSTDQVTEIIAKAGKNFSLLSGDDSMTLPFMILGGKGIISVVANIAPKDVSDLCAAALKGNWEEARKFHIKLYPLIKACFIETNPIPVKTASEMMGIASAKMRLPLCEMQEDTKQKLHHVMVEYGLLKA